MAAQIVKMSTISSLSKKLPFLYHSTGVSIHSCQHLNQHLFRSTSGCCRPLKILLAVNSVANNLHAARHFKNITPCNLSVEVKPRHPSQYESFSTECVNQKTSSGSQNMFVGVWVKCLALIGTSLALVCFLRDNVESWGVKTGSCTSIPVDGSDKSNPLRLAQEERCLGEKINACDFKGKEKPTSYSEAVQKAQVICQRKKDELETPGLVICVSVDGQQVYAQGFGYADLENEVPIRPNSVLRIASISKSVTSLIVAKLWENKKIDLCSPIQKYVSSFPEKHFLGEKVDITVDQLLNHTSGIRHYKSDDDPVYALARKVTHLTDLFKDASRMPFYCMGPNGKKVSFPAPEAKPETDGTKRSPPLSHKELFSKAPFPTVADSLKLFQDDPLMCKPGSKFIYSTHGMTLLSAVVEAAGSKPFSEQVNQTLIHLGLRETYLDRPEPIIYNRARYYMKNKAGNVINVPYVDNSYKWAGGGLLSTVEDVVRFGNILLYSAQHQDGDPGPPGYLKASTVWKFWSQPDREVTPRYGLGFEIRPEKEDYGMCGRHTFGAGHTGNAVGASSVLFILPRYTPSPSESERKNINQSSSAGETRSSKSVIDCDSFSNRPHDEQKVLQSKQNSQSISKEKESKELPQGVVVAVIVNVSGVDLRPVAHSIANIFEGVKCVSGDR